MADDGNEGRIGRPPCWSAEVTPATGGTTGRTVRCTVTCPPTADGAAHSPAAAAALSAAARVAAESGALERRGRRRVEDAPWAILGRLDAVGLNGFYRLRVQARMRPMKTFRVTIDGQEYDVTVEEVQPPAAPHSTIRLQRAAKPGGFAASGVSGGERVIRSPMPGKVLAVNVAQAASVDTDTVLLVLEAMKMENDILAPGDGTVKSIHVHPGDMVNTGDVMMVIE